MHHPFRAILHTTSAGTRSQIRRSSSFGFWRHAPLLQCGQVCHTPLLLLAQGCITFLPTHKIHSQIRNYSCNEVHLILLKILVLPYYRITIWLKNQKKPVQGIRFLQQSNIDLVQINMERRATASYPPNQVKGVEVAMLSKNSPIVKKFQQSILRKSTDD